MIRLQVKALEGFKVLNDHYYQIALSTRAMREKAPHYSSFKVLFNRETLKGDPRLLDTDEYSIVTLSCNWNTTNPDESYKVIEVEKSPVNSFRGSNSVKLVGQVDNINIQRFTNKDGDITVKGFVTYDLTTDTGETYKCAFFLNDSPEWIDMEPGIYEIIGLPRNFYTYNEYGEHVKGSPGYLYIQSDYITPEHEIEQPKAKPVRKVKPKPKTTKPADKPEELNDTLNRFMKKDDNKPSPAEEVTALEAPKENFKDGMVDLSEIKTEEDYKQWLETNGLHLETKDEETNEIDQVIEKPTDKPTYLAFDKDGNPYETNEMPTYNPDDDEKIDAKFNEFVKPGAEVINKVYDPSETIKIVDNPKPKPKAKTADKPIKVIDKPEPKEDKPTSVEPANPFALFDECMKRAKEVEKIADQDMRDLLKDVLRAACQKAISQ